MTYVKLEDVEKLVARMGLRCLESEENWIRALRALPIADGATDRVIAAILAAAYEGSQGEAIVGVEDAISALRSLPTDDGVTDEMVERAAKAICHDAGNPPTYWDEPATAGWVDYKDGVKRMYRNYARAALQAALGPLPVPPAC